MVPTIKELIAQERNIMCSFAENTKFPSYKEFFSILMSDKAFKEQYKFLLTKKVHKLIKDIYSNIRDETAVLEYGKKLYRMGGIECIGMASHAILLIVEKLYADSTLFREHECNITSMNSYINACIWFKSDYFKNLGYSN